jgi:hypothetical protein
VLIPSEENINDPWDDAYCRAFLETGERLVKEAKEAEGTDRMLAIEKYKRAATVYRISRFPYIGTPLKTEAYKAQKDIYLQGAALWDVPVTEVKIPFTHAGPGDEPEVPLYVRLPKEASPQSPVGVVLLITGLDGHRPDNTEVGMLHDQ